MSSTVVELRSPPLGRQNSVITAIKRTVAAGASHIRRPGLVARFTIIGATMALLVATTLAGLIEARLSAYIRDLTIARAIDQVELGILDYVSPADFQPPYTPDRIRSLGERLDPHLAGLMAFHSGVIRMHLFAPDGTVIYSDLTSKRGQVARLSPLLAGALAGQTGSDVSSLGSDENRELKARYGEAFEVYVPFTENGNVVGAYEIYTDPAPVRPIRQLVWIAVVGGFIILFLSLFAVVRNAGAFIRRQQVEREQLIRQNEERFRSLVGNTADVIAILDPAAGIRYASPPAERAWGRLPANLRGVSLIDYVHAEDEPAARDLLARWSRARP